jgi:hypothetical protein
MIIQTAQKLQYHQDFWKECDEERAIDDHKVLLYSLSSIPEDGMHSRRPRTPRAWVVLTKEEENVVNRMEELDNNDRLDGIQVLQEQSSTCVNWNR